MRDFRVTIRNIAVFLVIVLVLTMTPPVYYVFFNTRHYYYDNHQRDALAGKVDTLVSGASHALYSIDPKVYDQEMGTVSYSLAAVLLTMQARYELIQMELERNPVDTLILEVSYNTLTRDPSDHVEGDVYLLPRFNTAGKKIGYFLSSFRFDEWGKAYAAAFSHGISSVMSDRSFDDNRGFYPSNTGPVDFTLTAEEMAEQYHSEQVPTEPLDVNLHYLEKIVSLCREKGVRIIMVTVPVPKYSIVTYSGLEENRQCYADLAESYGFLFVDFNLHKQKDAVFPDADSFTDVFHMYSEKADDFTGMLTDTIRRYDAGEDISEDFYDSYCELLQLYGCT